MNELRNEKLEKLTKQRNDLNVRILDKHTNKNLFGMDFKDDADAKQFSLNIQNYNEIDFYQHEVKTRQIVTKLIDPLALQFQVDRKELKHLSSLFKSYKSKIAFLEDIVFQRKGFNHNSIFDKFYQKIAEVDKLRIADKNEILTNLGVFESTLKQLEFL